MNYRQTGNPSKKGGKDENIRRFTPSNQTTSLTQDQILGWKEVTTISDGILRGYIDEQLHPHEKESARFMTYPNNRVAPESIQKLTE
jgi:hypothetical protein